MTDADIRIRGTLAKVRWRSPEGNYVIAEFAPSGAAQRISILGNMAEPTIGQVYELSGLYKANHKFGGEDFHFWTYRSILPGERIGIYNYLIRTAKWVGPETAKALLDRYGDDTLAILKAEPDRVIADQIRGLTASKVNEMSESLRKNERLEAAMIEVGNLIGAVLGPKTCEKAIQRWGASAAQIIRRAPHRLAELRGVGFLKSDNLFMRLGGNPGALRRHVYAAMHVIDEQSARNGHTVVDSLTFDVELKKLVGVPHEKMIEALRRTKAVVFHESGISSTRMYEVECKIANRIRELQVEPSDNRKERWTIESVSDPESREMLSELEVDQFAALMLAMNSPVSIITGAPGTGKTFTVARIIVALRAATERVMLVASTGKAAKQIERALANTIPAHARTIHSALEPDVVDGEFVFNRRESNPLDCSTLIVDETSMVDVRLMASLLRATPAGCRLILVGDRWQLPPVGPGAVFRDLIAIGLPCAELKRIKRNAGMIVHACHAVKDGRVPVPSEKLDLDSGRNWRHIQTANDVETLAIIERLLSDVLRKNGIDPMWQAQIITPVNSSGQLSCDNLNKIARAILLPVLPVLPVDHCFPATRAGMPPARRQQPPERAKPVPSGIPATSNGDEPESEKNTRRLPFAVHDKIVRCKNGTAKAASDTKPCPICDGMSGFRECSICRGRGITQVGSEADIRIVNGDIGYIKEIAKFYVEVHFFFPDRDVRIPRTEHELRLAYALTCHKMQGSEVDVVILPLSKQLMRLPMVTREWLYTAMSRAKKFLVTVGNTGGLPEAIAKIGNTCRRTNLKELMGRWNYGEE